MKPLHLIALVMAFMLVAPLLYGGEPTKHRLSAHEDKFYSKFGGRVFTLYCGNREVSVWKKADGKPGWLVCPNQVSANAYRVVRRGRKWVRQ